MRLAKLFLHTLDELHERVESEDEYDVLMLAAALRKLLLDGRNSLVDRANREHRLKLLFYINDCPPSGDLGYWCVGDDLDPEVTRDRDLERVGVSRDELLKRHVFAFRRQLFTVKDIIRNAANVQGAVHFEEPEDPKEKTLRQATNYLSIHDKRREDGWFPVGLILLRSIGRVVLAGLNPLRALLHPGEPIAKPKPPPMLFGSVELCRREDLDRTLHDIYRRHLQRLPNR